MASVLYAVPSRDRANIEVTALTDNKENGMEYEDDNEGCAVCESTEATEKACLRCGQAELFCEDCEEEVCSYCQHMTSKED